jgi:hypothetical protein
MSALGSKAGIAEAKALKPDELLERMEDATPRLLAR